MGRFYTGMKGPDAVRKLNELDDSFAGALDGTSEIIEQAGNARDEAVVASIAAVSAKNLAQQAASEASAEVAAGVLALNAIREGADASRATAVLKATEAAVSATAADGARADAVLAREAADVSMMTASAKAAQSASDADATAADRAVVQTARGEAVQGAIDSLAGADAAEGHAMAAAAILTSVQAHGNGWTPKVALAVDGERRLMRVLSWSGGVGTAPPIGYLAETGVVADPALAINVRGGPGAAGTGAGSVTSVNNVPDLEGNVSLGIGDIPGLPQALAAAGQVKTVAGVAPSAGGDVLLTAEDLGAEPAGAAEAAVAALGESLAPVALTGNYADMSGDVVAGKLKLTAGLAEFDGPAGTYRNFRFMTNGAIRFDFGVDNGPETGGNAGSDFYLNAFDDAGGYIGSMLSISRRYGLYAPQINTQTAPAGSNSTGVATTEYVDRAGGNLANLATAAKTNFVSAINEVHGNSGNPADLTTTAKTDLVSAINELNAKPSDGGGVPIGSMVAMSAAKPLAFTGDGATWLRSGILTDAAAYPLAPSTTLVFGLNVPTQALSWRSVAYGGGVYVVLPASNGTAISSDDATTWSSRSLPASGVWTSVTYANSMFVAIASASTNAAYSYDGRTWTGTALPTSQAWNAVVAGSGEFMAFSGTAGTTVAARSTNGVNWAAVTMPAGRWQSAAYGPGGYVAVSYGTGSTLVATSPDGVTWTSRTLPYAGRWTAIAFGNGVYVAITEDGLGVATSPDGVIWTLRLAMPTGLYTGLVFGDGMFLAIGTAAMAYVSADGQTWTPKSLPAAGTWNNALRANGKSIITISGGLAVSVPVGGSSPAAYVDQATYTLAGVSPLYMRVA